MYIVIINYGDVKTTHSYKTKRQAYQKFSSWYNHGLDVCGQVKSTIEIWHNGICIDSDMY